MLFQVVTAEQCCNNMLTILFIVGRTTLFTPVDINLEQVVDFLNLIIIIINLHLYSAIPTKKFKSALQEWNGKNKIMYSLCYKFKIM